MGTFGTNPKFGNLEGEGKEIRNLGTFGTNPKFGDLGTNHTHNLGTKPIKVLKLFWLILDKAFSKILSRSLKKKRSCAIFRNRNCITKFEDFGNKILNLLMDWANKPKNTLDDFSNVVGGCLILRVILHAQPAKQTFQKMKSMLPQVYSCIQILKTRTFIFFP